MDAAFDRYIEEPIIAELNRLLPGQQLEPLAEQDTPSVYLNLPTPLGADYAFTLWIQPEWQIHAKLITADERRLDFWYMPFEDADFKSPSERDEAILATLRKIVQHETRIVQNVGLLFHSFRCEYLANDAWSKVYRMGYFRYANFNMPSISGRKHIYHCRPIAAKVSAGHE